MKRLMTAIVLVGMSIALTVSAQETAAAAMWDDAVGKEVLAQTEIVFLGVVEQMSVDPLKPVLAPDVVAYDIDFEGKPVKINSAEEAIQYFEAVFAETKKLGATAKLEKHSFTCRATSAMAFCLFEYDFVATMPDGSRMSQPTQTTIVLNKAADGWKWTHWHSALSASVQTSAPSK